MPDVLGLALAAWQPLLPLGVAYSGGADSTALLLACTQKWPGQVHAVHINHGLQAAAAEFERHCQEFCALRGIPVSVFRVDGKASAGQSPEDAARIARYQTLDLAARQLGLQSMAIAQHADDQVETVLMALMRGTGPAGLAGMPAHWTRDGIDYYRPLLALGRQAIRDYLAERQCVFVEDPTNQDQRFTRNKIRARLLPVLYECFPHAADTVMRTSQHMAEAQLILDAQAQQDWLCVCDPDKKLPNIERLQGLSRERQSNVLRWWLRQRHQTTPSSKQMDELLKQVAACRTRGHRIEIRFAAGEVHREGACLRWFKQNLDA